jgi:hypothetical protein
MNAIAALVAIIAMLAIGAQHTSIAINAVGTVSALFHCFRSVERLY